jgi:glutamyl-tRNA synthetase
LTPHGRQSERLDLYHKQAKVLLDQGKAYRCFCSSKALKDHWRVAEETRDRPDYSGTCRNISPEESAERARNGEPHCIRFLGHGKGSYPRFVDLVYGSMGGRGPIPDFVLIKGDGFPTYHFASVVDDKHMEITHVIRGAVCRLPAALKNIISNVLLTSP